MNYYNMTPAQFWNPCFGGYPFVGVDNYPLLVYDYGVLHNVSPSPKVRIFENNN